MCSKSPQAGAINGRSSEDHEAHRCVWYHLAQLQTHSIRQKEISPISQFTGWIRIKQTNCRGESNCSSLHCGDGAARFPGLTFIISEFINKATRSGQTQARLKAHSGENACLLLTPGELLPRYSDGADCVVWEEGAAEGRFCIADLHHAHTAGSPVHLLRAPGFGVGSLFPWFCWLNVISDTGV